MTLPLSIKAFVFGAASYVVTRWFASQLHYVMQAGRRIGPPRLETSTNRTESRDSVSLPSL
jgi:hypothetical protein